jgi:hypothetical protein
LIILLAVQAFDAVLDHQFVLSHHQAHGPVPLTLVGAPVAQVGVGVVAELNGTLQDPLIHAGLVILQDAVEPVHDPAHDHVCDHPHDPAEYPDGFQTVQVFAVPPQTPLVLHTGFTLLQAVGVVEVPVPLPLHHHEEVPPQDGPV